MAAHPEQGWSLLCNGVLLFEDTGELLPDGRIVAPRRPTDAIGSVLPLPLADTHAFVGGHGQREDQRGRDLRSGGDPGQPLRLAVGLTAA